MQVSSSIPYDADWFCFFQRLSLDHPPIQVDRDGEPNQFLTCRPRVICLERGDTWLKLSVDVVAAGEGLK